MLKFVTRRSHEVEGIDIQDNLGDFQPLLSEPELSIDIETTSLDPYLAEILLVSIGNNNVQYVIDYKDFKDELRDLINSYYGLWVGQNIKYDYSVLKVNGIILHHTYDIMITEQRLGLGSGRRNSLDAILKRRLDIEISKETRNEFKDHSGIFTTKQVIYSGTDVEHLLKVKRIQEALIEKLGMHFLIYEIEQPLVQILGDCELTGLDINISKWIEIVEAKKLEEIELNKQLYEELHKLDTSGLVFNGFKKPRKKHSLGLWSEKPRINFNSSIQLKSIFRYFSEDIPIGTRKNKEGEFEECETVGIKNLQLYLKQKPKSTLKSFLETFIKYKKVQKHISSFGMNYIDMINPITGRLHTIYRQCDTDTARLSSGDSKNNKPNLQQIPKLKELRECFSYKDYKILTIDLTGAELVILGSKAQDFRLIELNEGDMHSYLAQAAWRKILKDNNYIVSKEINKEKRQEFKNVNYGILYGAGIRKIAETLNISLEDAEIVFRTLNEEIPNSFRYMDEVSQKAIRDGYVVFNERTNSRRWFPDLSKKMIGKVKRAAINSPIQGTQADMLKEAMIQIYKYIKENSVDAVLLMQVHDELVFAFKDDSFPEKVRKILLNTVNKYLNGVEMKASYVVGNTWTKE